MSVQSGRQLLLRLWGEVSKMYGKLVKELRNKHRAYVLTENEKPGKIFAEAADAIEELQATLCNWCAVCSEDKRDLSTCEIYESCRAKPQKEE